MAWTVTKGSLVHVQWREDGRIRSRSTGTTDPRLVRRALEAAEARERDAERAAGGPPPRRPEDVLTDFLADRERRNCRPGTLRFYRGHLRPLFRDWAERPWAEWTRAALEAWIDQRRETARVEQRRGPGPAAVGSLVRACRALIAWAKETGVLVPDFLSGMEPPLVDAREPEPLDESQVALLVRSATKLGVRLSIALAGYLGLRRSEILRLTWEDVDRGAGTVRVVRKARAVLRLDVHPELDAVLGEAEAAQRLAGRELAGPVVRGVASSRDFTRWLREAYERAGLAWPKGRPLHLLRHTLASNLFRRGVAAHVVRDVMGHASLATTNRYSHSRAEERRAALLGGATPPAATSAHGT